ncbi:SAM-dependent methyltransferase [Luteipulveratus sp. YIM 133132]|uniref:SAM-dependent methyltransferase n=1 Tax=Luteipulveratus flavus TaxID=3031728 RepID=A0ABT6C233_9MICO|nr:MULTISPECIES: SAM-dependent methyltransferase [unclassified Luteipulveratus]MDE9364690.1 SAM-dependent methyltransferase [Luteipulveratus sp. YIM 133132]MDF8262850.1 SAM-dependent methyltransferase [Luteipulveratus sp. YIM 133296]
MDTPVLFSVAPDYYRSAVAELRRTLPVGKVTRVGEDAGIVHLKEGGQAEVAQASIAGDLRFVRHLAAVDAESPTARLEHLDAEGVSEWAADAALDELDPGDEVGLHVWDSGEVPWSPGKIRRPLLEMLMDNGVRVVTSGAERTVSVCVGTERTTAGVGLSGLGLCDWAGGRIRLAARKEQVSRAEFKLEELFGFIGTPEGDVAVDLGASPGGWTRILRSRGFGTVHAVDPAELDPRVLADDRVVHHRTTAGEFIAAYDEGPVDLIVNDMRMVPHLTAHTMVEAADLLRPGGQVVVTFKLGTNNPVKQTDESLETLQEAYEPTFIRQLQHNRHELTVVATRR